MNKEKENDLVCNCSLCVEIRERTTRQWFEARERVKKMIQTVEEIKAEIESENKTITQKLKKSEKENVQRMRGRNPEA